MLKITDIDNFDGKPDTVVHGDCLFAMQEIEDGSVDMVLADLPFGSTQISWDSEIPFDKLWEAFECICKPNAAIVLTATQPFAYRLAASKPEWFKYEIIWVKNKSTGHLNAKKQPMRTHEVILVFYKSPPTYNPQMTPGHEPLHYAVNKNQTKLYGKYSGVESRTGATDRYPQSVVYFDVVNQSDRLHETQKPVELFEYLIKTFTNENDVVLDCTAGSLTTAEACIVTGRRFICIEKERDYIDKAMVRFPTSIL